jgi:HEAT repeat protein
MNKVLILLIALLLNGSAKAEEALFPPIERLLGEAAPELPPAELDELRDSLNERPSQTAFMQAMRSKHENKRLAMVRAMAETQDVRALPYISAVLLNANETVPVRSAAAVAIGRMRHPLAKGYLAQATRDPSQEVRFAAVLALGKLEGPGVTPVLEERLSKDPSWWVRYAGAIALGQAKKALSVAALQRAATQDESWQVRMEASRALGEISGNKAAEALSGPLFDQDDGVRAVAALALAQNGTAQGLQLLRKAFLTEKNDFMRSLLASAIKKSLEK